MLPRNVFEHLKYGTGATPGASCTLPDGSEIAVSNEVTYKPSWTGAGEWSRRIVAKHYYYDAQAQLVVTELSLRECPEDADWQVYWTGEA